MRPVEALILPVAALLTMGCGPPDPETLYIDLGCPRCHGFHLDGNRYGPTLDGLSKNWDSAQSVVSYLRDPTTVVENDARLKAQDADYTLKMQPVSSRSDDDLIVLADWLLATE